MPLSATHATWTTPLIAFLILLPVPGWGLEMQWVPTSISVLLGEDATIPCNFHRKQDEKVNVSWVLIQGQLNKATGMSFMVQKNLSHAMQNLTIRNAMKTDSGVYLCSVTAGRNTKKSCGTYLRVRNPSGFLSFNVAEATKNRLITAEGIILLLCAIIPGTFLLCKLHLQPGVPRSSARSNVFFFHSFSCMFYQQRRMENLNSMSLKGAEVENLYEGLNLEDCSMYEDIARGLQATYEDVGTLRAADIHLEKP